MLFVISCEDKPDSLNVRLENREAHLRYLEDFSAQLVTAGPYLSGEGQPVGSMLIMEFADDAAAIAFRQCINRLIKHAMQFGHADGTGHGSARGHLIKAANTGDKLKKLARRHIRPSGRAFGQITELGLRRHGLLANINTRNARRACGWTQEAGYHFHGRRLAGTIGAKKAHHLTTLNSETEIINRCEVAKFLY